MTQTNEAPAGTGSPHPGADALPLCVDLDGTLIRSDLLVESVFRLIHGNVFYLFLLPVWLLRGKAYFKHQIAQRVQMDMSLLPYNEAFLALLREERARGRRLVLATASNERLARQVAAHTGLFDAVLASDAAVNLAGHRKLEGIRKETGEGGFDYAGNGRPDLEIWPHARRAILVDPTPGVLREAQRLDLDMQVIGKAPGGLRPYLRAIRIHQWLKNLLVFVPLILSHEVLDLQHLGDAFIAFLAFSLCASSVYLLNDFLDLENDRRHPTKRLRPFAAGSVPVTVGMALIPVLLLAAALLVLWLPPLFALVLGTYYAATLAYSLRLKKSALVDVLTLAGLYTLRIAAGAVAVSTQVSFWLLAFSMFLFLSLALAKRYSELVLMHDAGKTEIGGRGYRLGDLETLFQFGTVSAYMAVLVLALYINSQDVRELYTHPQLIWLLCPLLLYLGSRVWLLARRKELDEDPLVFAIQDRRSQWILGLGLLILWAAV